MEYLARIKKMDSSRRGRACVLAAAGVAAVSILYSLSRREKSKKTPEEWLEEVIDSSPIWSAIVDYFSNRLYERRAS
jgi:hypothetical protein